MMKVNHRKVLCVGLVVFIATMLVNAGDEGAAKDVGKKKEARAEQASAAAVRETAVQLASKLGDKLSQVREDATLKLIELGRSGNMVKPASEDKAAATPQSIVIEEMNKLKDSKDPEIAERAKRVIAALQPKESSDASSAQGGDDSAVEIRMEGNLLQGGGVQVMQLQGGGAAEIHLQVNGQEVQVNQVPAAIEDKK